MQIIYVISCLRTCAQELQWLPPYNITHLSISFLVKKVQSCKKRQKNKHTLWFPGVVIFTVKWWMYCEVLMKIFFTQLKNDYYNLRYGMSLPLSYTHKLKLWMIYDDWITGNMKCDKFNCKTLPDCIEMYYCLYIIILFFM